MARRGVTLAALTRLINVIAEGKVPAPVRPFFSSATLHGLPKPDGSLRPIAVGILLRRVTAKVIAKKLLSKAEKMFSPLQLGVGCRNACEGTIHAVNSALAADPSLWVMQVDLVSAFQRCDRGTMLAEVRQHFPEMLHFVQCCYGQHAPLFFGEHVVMSQMGTHQGDGISTILFPLVLHPIILKIDQQLPLLKIHTWYHDDGTLLGRKQELQQAVDVITEDGPARGLYLSTDRLVPGRGKTKVWSPDPAWLGSDIGEDPLERGTRKVADTGFRLLGAAVGDDSFTHRQLAAAVQKIKLLTAELPRLECSMSQYCLLRSTLSLTKFAYLLRTVNTSAH